MKALFKVIAVFGFLTVVSLPAVSSADSAAHTVSHANFCLIHGDGRCLLNV